MAETQELNWDEIEVNETLNDDAINAAADISNETPVGTFLCTIIDSIARENSMAAYTCIQANLKMRIDLVIEIEKPVMNNENKPVKRDGEVVKKAQKIEGDEQGKFNALLGGRFIFDGINLAHSSEKDAMKNRRIFVAQKTGLIGLGSSTLTTRMWGKDIIGKQVVVTTEWNSWKDKITSEVKKNVRVGWDGYDYAAKANVPADDDFGDI